MTKLLAEYLTARKPGKWGLWEVKRPVLIQKFKAVCLKIFEKNFKANGQNLRQICPILEAISREKVVVCEEKWGVCAKKLGSLRAKPTGGHVAPRREEARQDPRCPASRQESGQGRLPIQ